MAPNKPAFVVFLLNVVLRELIMLGVKAGFRLNIPLNSIKCPPMAQIGLLQGFRP